MVVIQNFNAYSFQENYRDDGRSRKDYRPMELETNILASSSGSARFFLANSDIIVGIKPEIDTPLQNRPNEGKLFWRTALFGYNLLFLIFLYLSGKIEFYVDCSANASLDFEGRGGEELALEISNCLAIAYSSSNAFDLKSLCILPKHQCWKLFVV